MSQFSSAEHALASMYKADKQLRKIKDATKERDEAQRFVVAGASLGDRPRYLKFWVSGESYHLARVQGERVDYLGIADYKATVNEFWNGEVVKFDIESADSVAIHTPEPKPTEDHDGQLATAAGLGETTAAGLSEPAVF